MLLKRLLVAFGFLSLLLGIIGTALPVVPAVPFLFAAYICFSRGSERFRNWYIQTKFHKQFIKAMAAPLRYKVIYILSLVCFFSVVMAAVYLFRDVFFGILFRIADKYSFI